MTRPAFARSPAALAAAISLVALVFPAAAAAAGSAPPAGGAPIGQEVAVTMAAMILTVALLVLGLGHRNGRVGVLRQAGGALSRVTGMPAWAVLPASLGGGALMSAGFGVWWDISLHIDNGRDPGPLANPAHYFILAGLFGLLAAGWFAIVMPERRPGAQAVRVAPNWYAPLGGVLILACASFALLGFPLDDVWHRLFGQDVTLWGPTHLMMISGAVLSLIGIVTLLVEGRSAARSARAEAVPLIGPLERVVGLVSGRLDGALMRRMRVLAACGGLLIGLSLYQAEFDFGVPQFRLLYDPVLIALAGSIALVMARVLLGRGAALGALVIYLAGRIALSVLVGPILGETPVHFAIYAPEALLVEAAALYFRPRTPYRFGIAAGVLIGSVGLLCEWAWSQAVMAQPWPAHMVPEALLLSVPTAIAGGVVGAFLGGALSLRGAAVARPAALRGLAASVLVIAGVLAFLGRTTVPAGATASLALVDLHPRPARTAQITARVHPTAVADGADWLTVTAWQGRAHLIVDRLRRVGPGVYRTTEPIPLYGSWKVYLRLQRGPVMASVPVYLPSDPAIPAPGLAAPASAERPFAPDHKLLQRERKPNVPTWLWGTAGLLVLSFCLVLLALIGWALVRLARTNAPDRPAPAPRRRRPVRSTAEVAPR